MPGGEDLSGESDPCGWVTSVACAVRLWGSCVGGGGRGPSSCWGFLSRELWGCGWWSVSGATLGVGPRGSYKEDADWDGWWWPCVGAVLCLGRLVSTLAVGCWLASRLVREVFWRGLFCPGLLAVIMRGVVFGYCWALRSTEL